GPADALPAGVSGKGTGHAPARGAPSRVPGPVPARIAGEPQLRPEPGHAGRGRPFRHLARHPVAASLLFAGLLAVGGGVGALMLLTGHPGTSPRPVAGPARPPAGGVAAPPPPAPRTTGARPGCPALP